MIKINKKGKILEGEHCGWYLIVQDDTENTGGYYILVSKNESFDAGLGGGFDSWIGDEKFLKGYFEESNWKIEWLE